MSVRLREACMGAMSYPFLDLWWKQAGQYPWHDELQYRLFFAESANQTDLSDGMVQQKDITVT